MTRTPTVAAAFLLAGAGAARAQGVQDPSFEASGPAYQNGGTPPPWQPTSTNFGAPFCDGACLGPGQPTAARTGEWWCWFGGTSAEEHATVSQVVALPAGPVVLRFYLLASTDRATATDTLRVLVDSTVVFSINNQQIGPYLADYAPVEADLSALAGAARAVVFDAVTHAGPGVTNFFVDDVSLVTGGAAPCYANCDGSTAVPFLNVADFTCFLQKFAAQDAYANCDGSTTTPVLNVADFTCFLQRFAAGCSAP